METRPAGQQGGRAARAMAAAAECCDTQAGAAQLAAMQALETNASRRSPRSKTPYLQGAPPAPGWGTAGAESRWRRPGWAACSRAAGCWPARAAGGTQTARCPAQTAARRRCRAGLGRRAGAGGGGGAGWEGRGREARRQGLRHNAHGAVGAPHAPVPCTPSLCCSFTGTPILQRALVVEHAAGIAAHRRIQHAAQRRPLGRPVLLRPACSSGCCILAWRTPSQGSVKSATAACDSRQSTTAAAGAARAAAGSACGSSTAAAGAPSVKLQSERSMSHATTWLSLCGAAARAASVAASPAMGASRPSSTGHTRARSCGVGWREEGWAWCLAPPSSLLGRGCGQRPACQ